MIYLIYYDIDFANGKSFKQLPVEFHSNDENIKHDAARWFHENFGHAKINKWFWYIEEIREAKGKEL